MCRRSLAAVTPAQCYHDSRDLTYTSAKIFRNENITTEISSTHPPLFPFISSSTRPDCAKLVQLRVDRNLHCTAYSPMDQKLCICRCSVVQISLLYWTVLLRDPTVYCILKIRDPCYVIVVKQISNACKRLLINLTTYAVILYGVRIEQSVAFDIFYCCGNANHYSAVWEPISNM